ncbi:hypothetical protein NDU88_009242 [Pleurodeles waltl]|uniref:Uncharacterized protein n=1 Tax=Pleurodeles waltl TaxID=8319 RepID=A0AAV7RZV4_PLEWA|nr:hypothetical protein NDU88_009242 [Pleurodeles waltl]
MQRLARGPDGKETWTRTSEEPSGPTIAAAAPCAQNATTDTPSHAIGAQSNGQLKTPDEHWSPIAEHEHDGAARLRSNCGRGKSRRSKFLGTAV